jgi:hypothetical protein
MRKTAQVLIDLGCGEVVNINDPAVVNELTVQYFRDMALEEYFERQDLESDFLLDNEVNDIRKTKRIFQGLTEKKPYYRKKRRWLAVY